MHHFLSLLADASGYAFVKTPEGRYIVVSPGFARLVGIAAEDMLGHSDAELLSAEVAAARVDEDRATLKSGALRDTQESFVVDGVEQRFRTSRVPFIIAQGEAPHVLGVSWAIDPPPPTEALQAREAELARQRRMISQTQRASGVGGWEVDIESGALYWTEETFRIHELDPASRTPTVEGAIAFYTPESRPVIQRLVEAAMETGAPFDEELEVITAAGRRRWVRAAGQAECVEGRPVKVFGWFQDVTRQREAREELQLTAARLRLAQDCAGMGSWTFRPRSGAVEWSPEVMELFGVSAEEWGGRYEDYLALTHPDDRGWVHSQVTAVLRRGGGGDYQLLHRIFRRGELRWVEGRGRVLRDEAGEVSLLTGMVWDVTERQLAEARMEQVVRELEAKNAELEAFTHTVSHDLKTPLVTIKGFLSTLEASVAAGEMDVFRADCARIERAADHMRRLLDDLLALSRAGRVAGTPEPIDSGLLVRRALELVAGELERSGAQLEVAPQLPRIRVDRRSFEDVFVNLVANAVRFSKADEAPRIRIGSRAAEREDEALLFVADEGVGLDPALHERIFRLFERVDYGVEGTGVGLALVKRIVERQGGRVWVESEGSGRGCCFCVAVPLAEEGWLN